MLLPRTVVTAWTAGASLALLSLPAFFACSSTDGGAGGAGSSAGGSVSNQSGSPATGGATAGGANGAGGSTPLGGAGPGTSGAATAGNTSGGVTGGGAAGAAGSTTGGATTGGMGGMDAGDTPPWRPINVMAAIGEHVHGKAGVDTRAKTMLGKLVVDVGVNAGNYSSFLAKRGYHSMGAPCGMCPAPDLDDGNRERVSACRLTEFNTMAASVKSQLTMLSTQYPEEDWGYFLNKDGSVRFSDVAITGISHGATASAVAGRIGARMWRIVSRSGPRDNICGLPAGKCTAPLSTPAYDPACPDSKIAAWLDKPSLTPMDRFYALVGLGDTQCGDIMFNMQRTKYLGVPTIFDNAQAVLTGTNQFFSATQGHYDFLAGVTGVPRADEALEIAFAIPPENRKPSF